MLDHLGGGEHLGLGDGDLEARDGGGEGGEVGSELVGRGGVADEGEEVAEDQDDPSFDRK